MIPTQNKKELLTVREVAQATSLSEAFWRKAILNRRISFAKLGRRVVIRRCDLDAWIAVRMVEAATLQS